MERHAPKMGRLRAVSSTFAILPTRFIQSGRQDVECSLGIAQSHDLLSDAGGSFGCALRQQLLRCGFHTSDAASFEKKLARVAEALLPVAVPSGFDQPFLSDRVVDSPCEAFCGVEPASEEVCIDDRSEPLSVSSKLERSMRVDQLILLEIGPSHDLEVLASSSPIEYSHGLAKLSAGEELSPDRHEPRNVLRGSERLLCSAKLALEQKPSTELGSLLRSPVFARSLSTAKRLEELAVAQVDPLQRSQPADIVNAAKGGLRLIEIPEVEVEFAHQATNGLFHRADLQKTFSLATSTHQELCGAVIGE